MSLISVYPRESMEPFLPIIRNGTNISSPVNIFTYFMSTVYVLLLLGGLLGNTWAVSVIVWLFKNRAREPPRNVQLYILILCLIDTIVLIFMTFTINDMLNGEWTLIRSTMACKLYLCSDLLNKFLAPLILMALSGTCYTVVCRRQCRGVPDDLRMGGIVITLSTGVVCVLMAPIFVYGDLQYLVVHGPPASNGSRSNVKYIGLKCMFHPKNDESIFGFVITHFVLYTFIVGYAIPTSAFTVFYVLIWRFVRQHSWRARSLLDSWRVARTVVGLVAFFVFCWTPYWSMLLYSNANPQYRSTDRHPITLAFIYMTHLLPYINCLGYPIIYIVLNRKIKENYQLIRAKRRSQIMALCGLIKNRTPRSSTKRQSIVDQTTKSIDTVNNNLMPPVDSGRQSFDVQEIDEHETVRIRHSITSRQSPSNDEAYGEGCSGNGSSSDSQSLFAHMTEWMELSRHLLIPLIQINLVDPNDTENKISEHRDSHPDVIL